MIYKYYIIYIKYILHTYKCYIYYNIHMHPDNFLPLLIIDTFRIQFVHSRLFLDYLLSFLQKTLWDK